MIKSDLVNGATFHSLANIFSFVHNLRLFDHPSKAGGADFERRCTLLANRLLRRGTIFPGVKGERVHVDDLVNRLASYRCKRKVVAPG